MSGQRLALRRQALDLQHSLGGAAARLGDGAAEVVEPRVVRPAARPRDVGARWPAAARRRATASSRSVGIAALSQQVAEVTPARPRSALHGARNASSSRRLRHWRTRASAQNVASRREPQAAPAAVAARQCGASTCAATSATLASIRSSHCRAAASVVGRRVVGGLELRLQPGERRRRRRRRPRRRACRSVSLSPSNHCATTILSSGSASSPARSVSRWPARLPLSTAET